MGLEKDLSTDVMIFFFIIMAFWGVHISLGLHADKYPSEYI